MKLVDRKSRLCGGHEVKHLVKVGAVLAMALGLTACSSIGAKLPWAKSDASDTVNKNSSTETTDYSLIASNLLDAVSQYPKFSPLLATVQVAAADNAFEQQVYDEMQSRGYKLETLNSGDGINSVNATIESTDDSEPVAPLYVLSIGELSAERQYATSESELVPMSELVIRGADERSIVLNDSDVFASFDPAYSKVVFEPAAVSAISSVFKPQSDTQRASVDAQTPGLPVKHNIYETMESNYVSLLDEYEEVDQHILVFPNDSLRLGEANKQTIQSYVAKMNPETDVLSVIGCSHGKTEISNGNSVLAIGRANRVKEAFVFSGIEHDRVLDEGCWAPQTFDEVMPQRGVVLTLKRRKES